MPVDVNQLRGFDAEEIARRGAVSGALLRQVRANERLAKKVDNLRLFGEGRNCAIEADDPPLIQLLKEQAAAYHATEDRELKQKALHSMCSLLLGINGKQASMFDSLLNLVKDLFKIQSKTKGKDIDSDRDLLEVMNEAVKQTDG